jgi:hypothetical protein
MPPAGAALMPAGGAAASSLRGAASKHDGGNSSSSSSSSMPSLLLSFSKLLLTCFQAAFPDEGLHCTATYFEIVDDKHSDSHKHAICGQSVRDAQQPAHQVL